MNAAEHNRIIAERFWNDPKWAHTSDHVKWTMYLERKDKEDVMTPTGIIRPRRRKLLRW
jgi:hypothetical protein